MVRLTVHFSGRVQGVGFRYTTVNIAKRFAVCGYVQNLHDGRVRLVAEGAAGDVKGLVGTVLSEMGRYVDSHTVDEGAATGEFGEPGREGLEVRY